MPARRPGRSAPGLGRSNVPRPAGVGKFANSGKPGGSCCCHCHQASLTILTGRSRAAGIMRLVSRVQNEQTAGLPVSARPWNSGRCPGTGPKRRAIHPLDELGVAVAEIHDAAVFPVVVLRVREVAVVGPGQTPPAPTLPRSASDMRNTDDGDCLAPSHCGAFLMVWLVTSCSVFLRLGTPAPVRHPITS